MSRSLRFASYAAASLASYVLLLLVAGVAAQGCVTRKLEAKIGATVRGEASVGELSLGLLTGSVVIKELKAKRSDSTLVASLQEARISIAPLGAGVFMRTPRKVTINGLTVNLTGAAPLQVESEPMLSEELELNDVKLALQPAAWLAGFGELVITIHHAKAQAVAFHTPLSWLFVPSTMTATVSVAGVSIDLHKHDGIIAASGSVFGSTPVTLGFGLEAKSPQEELEAVTRFGRQLAQEALLRKARDLVK